MLNALIVENVEIDEMKNYDTLCLQKCGVMCSTFTQTDELYVRVLIAN